MTSMRATWLAALTLSAAGICAVPSAGHAQVPQRDAQLDVAETLVKNVLTAVNQANLTGNYTVLRDLGGPAFRERNNAAQLATIFQRLREQKSDLSPILMLKPVFNARPGINQAGGLELVGYFPTQPLQVQFHLEFQHVGSGWMIDTVSVTTAATQQQALQPAPQQPYGGAPSAGLPYLANRPADGYSR